MNTILGECYRDGTSVQQNIVCAMELYEEGRRGGCAGAALTQTFTDKYGWGNEESYMHSINMLSPVV
eukprot:11380763-Karenia_brevis.AAC.1